MVMPRSVADFKACHRTGSQSTASEAFLELAHTRPMVDVGSMNGVNTEQDSNPDPAGIRLWLKCFKGYLGGCLRRNYLQQLESNPRDLAVESKLYDEDFWSQVAEFIVDNDFDPLRYLSFSYNTLSKPAWPSALLSPALAMRYRRRQADTDAYFEEPKADPRQSLDLFTAYVRAAPDGAREVLERGHFGGLFKWCIALRLGLDDVERDARGDALYRLLDPERRRTYGEVFHAEIRGWAAKHFPG